MRSAVDSSILFDVLLPDPKFGPASAKRLREAIDGGVVVACEVVWAEVRGYFPSEESFNTTVAKLGIEFDPVSEEAARMAGKFWRDYRSTKKSRREHLIPDFLVGAHALHQTDVLISRDRGFYRRCFSGLKLIDPALD